MNLWRFQWLLYAFVALLVAGPYLLLREAGQRIQQADTMLAHISHVEATASRLLFEVRDLESSAGMLVAGIDVPNIRRRIAESQQAIPQLLDTLIELTHDNPEQQVRVGELKTRIEQRVELTGRIIDVTDPVERKRLLQLMVDEFPMRNAAMGVLKEERLLLERQTREAVALRRQGHWISVSAMIGQIALLCLLLWITLRQQRRRALAEQDANTANARALSVMQSIRDPIALIDSQKKVVMHNTAFDEMYGGTGEGGEIDGLHLSRIGNGAWTHRETLQRLRDVVSRGRELWDFEVRQTTADGVGRTMLLNARRINLPDRVDEVALLTLSDISHQKAAEEEISGLNRQLEGKIEQVSDVNRELEAFSYSVSHDLRAPLRHISGFAEKLQRHLGDGADEKALRYIATIDASARRMAALIDDLLVYSRLGRSALRLQPVDMQSMVSEIRAMLDATVDGESPERRIEWRIAPLPVVLGDENMLRQVWTNLLGNAVKYTGTRDVARIDIDYRHGDEGQHEFIVADNGVGFDMAYSGKLFGVFQRLHKASEFAGTGIGLANVKRVLTRHGGDIQAEARPDEGATFRFTLPHMLDNPSWSPRTAAER